MPNAPLKKIGILGGTFNPIHYGHLRLALELTEALALDECRFLPCKHPVLPKENPIPAHHRVALCRLATESEPRFSVDERECERDTPSYSIDTLRALRKEFPEASFYFIVGKDSYATLPQWHEWQSLFELTHFIVVERPAFTDALPNEVQQEESKRRVDSIEALTAEQSGLIYYPATTHLAISASHIRELLQQGLSPRYLLPNAVLDYINLHHLF